MKKITIAFSFIIAVLFTVSVPAAYAGSLTPPGAAADTMYTLTNLYNLSAGTTATLGSGTIPTTPASVSASFYSLTDIYNAIAAQIAALANGKIASGVSAFGYTGTLFGDTDAAKVLTTATYPGTIPVKTGDTSVASSSTQSTALVLTIPQGYYSGSASVTVSTSSTSFTAGNIKSGINLFGIAGSYSGLDTSDSTAGVGDILSPKTAYVNGSKLTGTMPTNTLSSANDTVSAGYYAATTLSAVDTDLAEGNIKSGTTIFGKVGTVIQSLGNAIAANVLSTATFSNASAANISGTMPTNTLSSANDTVSAGYYAATTLSAVDTDLAAGNIASGVTVFGIAGTKLGAQLLKTNQTICYDAAGSVVTCAGTGQDGAYLKGATRSYTDPVNSTITDNNTGLMWKKCSEGLSGASCATGAASTYTWTNALAQCEADTTASFTDWRLPNVYELYSLVDFGIASAPFINGTYFPATQSSYYWSSTTCPAYYAGAMLVGFYGGNASNDGKAVSYYVRCVRG